MPRSSCPHIDTDAPVSGCSLRTVNAMSSGRPGEAVVAFHGRSAGSSPIRSTAGR